MQYPKLNRLLKSMVRPTERPPRPGARIEPVLTGAAALLPRPSVATQVRKAQKQRAEALFNELELHNSIRYAVDNIRNSIYLRTSNCGKYTHKQVQDAAKCLGFKIANKSEVGFEIVW